MPKEISAKAAIYKEQLSHIEHHRLYKTTHALTRMAQRGFNDDQIALVLKYGRVIYAKGIVFFVVGRKEVAFLAKQGVDLRAVEAIQLLTKPNGVLITVYRNHDLKKIKKTKY